MDAGVALQQSSDQSGNVGALLQQEKTELGPMQQNLSKTMDRSPAPPQLEKSPQAPDANFSQGATEWLSVLNVLAGIGGAKSRQGATAALTAFSQGLNSFKDGKLEQYKLAQEQWKDANQSVIENNKAQVDAYKSALQDKKLSIDEQMSNIKLIAAQYHNDIMGQFAEARNFTAIARVMDSMQSNNDKLQQGYEKMQQHVDEATGQLENVVAAKDDYNAAYPTDPATGKKPQGTPDFKTWFKQNKEAYGQQGGAGDEASVHQMAEGLFSGMKPYDLGLPTRTSKNPTLEAVRKDLAKNHPEFDYAKAQLEWAREKAGATTVGRTAAQIKLAENILDSSVPSLLAESKKYGLGPSTDLNTVVNTMKKHASSQEYTNFSTQLRAVTTDYMMFIGRGRPTVHSDEEALKILKENGGPTSLQGFADAVKVESTNVNRGIDKTQGKSTPAASGGNDGGDNSDPLGIR